MNLSSATNGSQGLKKKIPIRVLTFTLFAVGAFLAALAIYQQFATSEPAADRPFKISRAEAIIIGLFEVDKEHDRDAAFVPNEQATAKLVHVTNGGIGFVADENSLSDMWLYSLDQRFLDVYENTYLWHVDVSTSNNEGARGYWYLIDANSGEVITNDRDYAAFSP